MGVQADRLRHHPQLDHLVPSGNTRGILRLF